MGQNNRQRRAAKQRQRSHTPRSAGPRPGSASNAFDPNVFGAGSVTAAGSDFEALAAADAARLLRRAIDELIDERPPRSIEAFRSRAERHQQAAVDAEFSFAVKQLIAGGWSPLDLYEVTRRKATGSGVTHLLDVVAAATAQHAERLVHPQWRAQLDQLGASVPASSGGSPSGAWGRRTGLGWTTAVEQLLSVLVVIGGLPRIERVLPAPGEDFATASSADGVDGKVLRRIRGLLAKAESTEHPEEADALTAKAQELMTRYSIERAVAESAQPTTAVPGARRLWLESPYVEAKALLVEAVSAANNCRAIQSVTLGYVTIVGHRSDLDLVELLITSLLVQATRAMALAGPQQTHYGTSRTRSYRRSFLIAYADRIGERLTESAQAGESTYASEHGGALVPVLAARREAVDDKLSDLFPNTIERRVSVSDRAGWGAGRAAADLAELNVRTPVSPSAS